MFDGLRYAHGALTAQERGYHQQGNALLGGFDPVGLLAGLSFIAFLLHALLSFLFRPSASGSYYLPQAHSASSRASSEPVTAAHGLLNSAIDYYYFTSILLDVRLTSAPMSTMSHMGISSSCRFNYTDIGADVNLTSSNIEENMNGDGINTKNRH